MPILLLRVDERLIHGQVVVGWGAVLRPDRIVVIDDALAQSLWEQELYCLGLPPEVQAEFTSIDSARSRIAAWRDGDDRVLILTRDVDTMLRLAHDGLLRGEDVNIGGIHHAPGRREVLPYVYLAPSDEDALRQLAQQEVTVSASDLPSTRRVTLDQLLAGGAS